MSAKTIDVEKDGITITYAFYVLYLSFPIERSERRKRSSSSTWKGPLNRHILLIVQVDRDENGVLYSQLYNITVNVSIISRSPPFILHCFYRMRYWPVFPELIHKFTSHRDKREFEFIFHSLTKTSLKDIHFLKATFIIYHIIKCYTYYTEWIRAPLAIPVLFK